MSRPPPSGPFYHPAAPTRPVYYLAAPTPPIPPGYYLAPPIPPGYYLAPPILPGYYPDVPIPPGYYSAAQPAPTPDYYQPQGHYPTQARPQPPRRPYVPPPRPKPASPPEQPILRADVEKLYKDFLATPEDIMDNSQLQSLSAVLLDSPKWEGGGFLLQKYRKIIRNLIKKMKFLLQGQIYCKVEATDVMIMDGPKYKLGIMKSTRLCTYDDFRREFRGLMEDIFTTQDRCDHLELRDFFSYISTLTQDKFFWLMYHPLLHSLKQRSNFLCKGVKVIREHFWGSGFTREDLTRDCRRVWGRQITWPDNIGGLKDPVDAMFAREAIKRQYGMRDVEASVRLGRNILEHLDKMLRAGAPVGDQSIRGEVVGNLYEYFPELWICLYKYLVDYNIDITFKSEFYGKKPPPLARKTS